MYVVIVVLVLFAYTQFSSVIRDILEWWKDHAVNKVRLYNIS